MHHPERYEIEIPADLASFVHARIGNDAPSADKVASYVHGLIRGDHERARNHKEVVRRKIAEGMRSARAGEGIDGDTFMTRMDEELAELESKDR